MRAKARVDAGMDRPLDKSSSSNETQAAVSRVLSGDHEAFAILVEANQSRLLSLCRSLVQDSTIAEDLAQDAFVRAFEHLRSFDPRRPFFPWLAKIAVRLAQNRWQRIKRQPIALDRDDRILDQADSSPEIDPSHAVLSGDRGRQVWRATGALTTRERVVVSLFYRHELSVNDTARVLGVTAGTVKTLLFRARKRLRQKLEPYFDGPDLRENR